MSVPARCSRTCHFAIAGFQNCLYSLRRILSVSYFDQSSGDDSYHVVEESCSCYTYGYDISVTPYINSCHCTDSCFLPALLHRRKKQNHAVRSGMRLLLSSYLHPVCSGRNRCISALSDREFAIQDAVFVCFLTVTVTGMEIRFYFF